MSRNIIVIACQLHYSKGSEYAVAFDYIKHMSRNNRLTVIYGTSNGYHNIGNTGEMEQWCEQNAHTLPGVTFIPLKPSKPTSNYSHSLLGSYLFYKEYALWLEDARARIDDLCRREKYDLVHFLGPIGYREPGSFYRTDIPSMWGPIGGFGANILKMRGGRNYTSKAC